MQAILCLCAQSGVCLCFWLYDCLLHTRKRHAMKISELIRRSEHALFTHSIATDTVVDLHVRACVRGIVCVYAVCGVHDNVSAIVQLSICGSCPVETL